MCSHQGGHVLNLHHPRHHGSGRQLQQPLPAPFFNCPAQNEDFGPAERGPAGPFYLAGEITQVLAYLKFVIFFTPTHFEA